MYFLIVALGFMLAVRGARPAPLQQPREGLVRVWREALDFFLTLGLALALLSVAGAYEPTRIFEKEYAILSLGLVAYLLSRYQKKTTVFFLAAAVTVFGIYSRQKDLLLGLFLAWAVSAGIGIFQTGFLGLRYRLLFSNVPAPLKGWPVLCLLAGSVSVILWSVARSAF